MRLDPKRINDLVASLGLMKFFPSDPAVRAALVEVLGEICNSDDEAKWLVKEMRVRYAEWPGEQEMRRVFCRYFRPRDGIIVSVSVGDYAGEPYSFTLRPEQPWPLHQIVEPTIPLPRGKVSADPALNDAVKDLTRRIPGSSRDKL